MGQTTIPSSIIPRVSALLRMLGSPIDAEALGATRALGRTLAGAGCDFHDLADVIGGRSGGLGNEHAAAPYRPAPAPSAAAPSDTVTWKAAQRRAVAQKLRAGLHSRAFNSWEAKFAADVADFIDGGRRRFSPKQVATAEELAAKVANRSRAA